MTSLKCQGINKRTGGRCHNPTLITLIGPSSKYCAQHIDQQSDSWYSVCHFTYPSNNLQKKKCQEVVLKKFGVCWRHFDLYLESLPTSNLNDTLNDSLNFLNEQICDLVTRMSLFSKSSDRTHYYQYYKALRKYKSMRNQVLNKIESISSLPQIQIKEEFSSQGNHVETFNRFSLSCSSLFIPPPIEERSFSDNMENMCTTPESPFLPEENPFSQRQKIANYSPSTLDYNYCHETGDDFNFTQRLKIEEPQETWGTLHIRDPDFEEETEQFGCIDNNFHNLSHPSFDAPVFGSEPFEPDPVLIGVKRTRSNSMPGNFQYSLQPQSDTQWSISPQRNRFPSPPPSPPFYESDSPFGISSESISENPERDRSLSQSLSLSLQEPEYPSFLSGPGFLEYFEKKLCDPDW